MELTLVSHALCPYVQRAAIVLAEKKALFSRRYVDLSDKPAWFLDVSPLGKTPVLLVNNEAIFESAVICEFLDETLAPTLHPQDPLERAQHRGWMEFGSAVLNTIASLYNAPDSTTLAARRDELRVRFAQLEAVLGTEGPFFAGPHFSVVDAVFAPVFRYFDVFEQLGEPDIFEMLPRVRAWRAALGGRPSVRDAAPRDYAQLLEAFLVGRDSELARRIMGRCLA